MYGSPIRCIPGIGVMGDSDEVWPIWISVVDCGILKNKCPVILGWVAAWLDGLQCDLYLKDITIWNTVSCIIGTGGVWSVGYRNYSTKYILVVHGGNKMYMIWSRGPERGRGLRGEWGGIFKYVLIVVVFILWWS